MAKKILGIILSVLLVVLSVVPAFADSHSKGETKKGDTIESLKKQLKENHKNKETRTDILKKLIEERKAENKNHIPVIINGNELETDTQPVLKENRILIPIRAVTNSLGAIVTWDAATNTATITKTVGDSVYNTVSDSVYGTTYNVNVIKIVIKLGSGTALVNGKEVKLDTKADSENNRMMVPLRFIAETFKSLVEWDSNLNCAIIEEDNDKTPTPEIKVPIKKYSNDD